MDENGKRRMITERLERLERLTAAQSEAVAEQFATRTFTGEADRGGIVATVDAMGTLLALDISRLSKRRLDGVTLGDALIEAVHAAEQAANEARTAMMRTVSSGHGLGDLFGDALRIFGPR
ncbi:YbaB/EbfC family nucleoid-associated protein [Nonomuraea sp. NBC_01738]|uniref:YbaB/EbfC family nucleoid-associated protein n=1 Tax=Nonomuraea sp. NBC_01738 TaxID=2976003 RepID=UPI002E1390C1|nr:YbaB/EbfC family nucleoid-associated protein [Nonomuraea sp. NBC_01738]